MRTCKKVFMALSITLMLLTGANAGFAKTIKWKVAYGGAPNDPAYAMVKGFADALDKKSNGTFKLKIVLTKSLGYSMADTLQFLKQGLAQTAVIVPHYLARDERLFSVMLPQGVLLDAEDNFKMMGLVTESSKPIYERWGIDLVVPVMNGTTVDWIIISKEPINTLAHLQQKKFRHSDKIAMIAMKRLGISAQRVPLTETYMGLKTGVVDGAFFGRLYTLKQSLDEVTKYISYIGPYSVAMMPGIGANKKAWAKLPDDKKKLFTDVGKAVLWDFQMDKWKTRGYENYSAAELKKKGMVEIEAFSIEDRMKIQKAILEVWREECEKLGPEAVAHYNKAVSLIKTEL